MFLNNIMSEEKDYLQKEMLHSSWTRIMFQMITVGIILITFFKERKILQKYIYMPISIILLGITIGIYSVYYTYYKTIDYDDVANNIEAVLLPTSSNTVLIEAVSAFKEPVVFSNASFLSISEAVLVPTVSNLVLNELVESPNDFVTLAKTTDDDNIAPAPNSDADATAPSPNKDAEAIAPPENSFANFLDF